MAIGHRKGLSIAAGIAVVVAGSLYFAGPWALRNWAVDKLRETTGQPVTMEHLGFNPFTATASLAQLTIGDSESPIIHVDKGEITLAWRTLWQSGIHIKRVDLNGPLLHLVQTPEGDLNITRLGGSEDSGESTALSIDSINAHQGEIDWVNQSQSPSTQLAVTDLALTLEGYDSRTSSPMKGQATGTLNGGQLSAKGQFGLSPLTGDLQMDGQQIGLDLINPWLSQMSNVQVDKGTLSGHGTLAFGEARQGRVQWQGDLDTKAVSLLDGLDRPLFSADQARLTGMDLLTGDHLSADRLSMSGSKMMAIIDEQGEFNLTNSLGLQSDESSAPKGDAQGDGAQASDAQKDEPQQNDSSQQGSQQGDSSQNGSQGDGMALALGRLEVSDGVFNFEDRNMSPTVSLGIDSLEGTMEDFDTRRDTPTSYSFKGFESQRTPVVIEGRFNASEPSGVMHLVVDRLPLERFAPYIQRFGGYRIEQGTADLDLSYRLRDGHLDADNHVVLRQLDLGEEVPEGDTSLPLKKLIGILKGDDGVINLDIPINASVEGAGIDVSKVIWQVIGEAMENMVTSPIETLDAMINGDDDDTADKSSGRYTEGPLSQVATEPHDD
ncbi:DUF748 domain-containing protein [Kushneria phyllosphaerae]|uniref:AsmA-like C-terminal domain-containing protein n=1 Tax=Kushneria phyllosphaerae TaxID=2100822 RepID=A0A2R8CKZ0_9GAMM|nr:DUF748 domain-containing protein [Kushneria phyllosphaerae]SPJ33531.1 hypothetical protein KSP9073_01540 [Kushneria phyllosphaerae]